MTNVRHIAMLVLLPAIIAGCDSAPVNALFAPQDGQNEIRAGRWTITATTRSFDVTQASPAEAQRYGAVIGQSHSQDHCLSAEEAKLGPMAMAEGFKQGDCQVAHFNAAKGQIAGQIACKIAGGGSVDMQIGGRYTPDSIAMVLTNDLRQPSLPGGKARMVMDITGTRLGDCPA